MPERSSLDVGRLPYWTESAVPPAFERIDRDIDVDVVVIGGGITGLTTAYLLLAGGKSVAVLERARCAQVDTGHTSAHVTMVTDARVSELVRTFGRDHARAVWDAGRAAIDQIDRIINEHDIDCDFEWVDGFLHAPAGVVARDDANSFKEDARLARELGFDASFVDDVPFAGGSGVRVADQGRFHPRKYMAGLAQAVRAKGGLIFEQSAAEEFYEQPLRVQANGRRVRCSDIVVATHNPLAGVASSLSTDVFQTKLALYTTYVIAGRVPRGSVPDALYWDTADPYHYLRIDSRPDHDIVIFGGEDHKTGQESDTEACFARLEKALRARLSSVVVSYRWSGQVIETPDGLPYIGKMADHQYAATGFAGNGMTFGTLAAIMIADAIEGRQNPWVELFDPGRAAIRHGLWDYVTENADYPYYMVRDRLTGTESRSLRAVKPGHGKIIQVNGQRVAAYRDQGGAVTLRSAICTHLGCTVTWNDADRSWDCPCHGSRFTPEGGVISGPAQTPLAEVEEPAKSKRVVTSR